MEGPASKRRKIGTGTGVGLYAAFVGVTTGFALQNPWMGVGVGLLTLGGGAFLFRILGSTTVPPGALEAFRSVLLHETEWLQQLNLEEDHKTFAILKGLRTAQEFHLPAEQTDVESLISGVTLSGVEFNTNSVQTSTLFFRKFYPALLNNLLKSKYSILTGNPGISKSWFHWYILYCVVRGDVVNGFNPTLIVRLVSDRQLVFIFPKFDRVYCTYSVSIGLALLSKNIQPDVALLLIEPEDSFVEPVTIGVQTILTCSPDVKRYKEFLKQGAGKYFMPVWKVEELQLVADHIHKNTTDRFLKDNLTPKGIKYRYYQFGGIFRYVIPVNDRIIKNAKSEQELSLSNTKPADTFIQGTNIEKRDNKDNISHFLLQYNVDETTFDNFTMTIASEFIEKRINSQSPNAADLHRCIDVLIHMFRGFPINPLLFEYVIFHMLVTESKWTVFDGKGWVERDFDFCSNQTVASYEEEVLKEMEIGILYRPVDPYFPAVDIVWAEEISGEKEYFCVQVTFAKSHRKSKSVYEKLYVRLGLNKRKRVNVYIVTNPIHADTYAEYRREQYFTPQVEFDYNLKFAPVRSDELEKRLRKV